MWAEEQIGVVRAGAVSSLGLDELGRRSFTAKFSGAAPLRCPFPTTFSHTHPLVSQGACESFESHSLGGGPGLTGCPPPGAGL